MYPRLALLHQMMREDGSIWMSIDDNEVHHARSIMDEIFGAQNFIATVIWQKIFAPKGSARHLSENHEFILVYARNSNVWTRNLQPRTQRQDERYKNYDNDVRGIWSSDNLTARNYYGAGTYPITTPSGRVISGPPKGTYWRISKETFDELDRDNRIWWGKDGNNMPRLKRFLSDVQDGIVPQTIWEHEEVGNTQEAKKEIVKIVPIETDVFSTPKPTRLLRRILQIATDPGDLVLDSFAGSGTTGNAILQMNNEDGGNRRFILVEIDNNIAQNITAERLKRAAQGYTYKDQKGSEKQEAGLGGGFRFCELGATLFDGDGQIREEVKYNDLAQHVYFIETGQPLPQNAKKHFPLLGVSNDTAVYLLYNGILKDKSVHGGNVLTNEVLQSLPEHTGAKVIYGNGSRIGANRLRELGITFKQIPYEIKE